jgi:hypothetical protein
MERGRRKRENIRAQVKGISKVFCFASQDVTEYMVEVSINGYTIKWGR